MENKLRECFDEMVVYDDSKGKLLAMKLMGTNWVHQLLNEVYET